MLAINLIQTRGNAMKLIGRIPGQAYLLLAILIFAAANPVIRRLTQLGAQNLIDGRNPISFCNVLFVGNLCALLVLIPIFRQQWNANSLKQLSQKNWLSLIAVTILGGTLSPALTFSALSLTTVNNVVLIGRLEPPLVLALSVWLLRERVNSWVVGGAVVSFIGVALTILLQKPSGNMVSMGGGMEIGQGELLAAIAAICLAVSTIISRASLRQVPLGIFSIFRTAMGAVVFFVAAIALYGAGHFMDVFSPFLWQWMLVYGAVIIVGGQLCWYTGLKSSSASEVSLASSFSPVAGICAAFLILGEAPTFAQYVGGSAILVGIVLTQMGNMRSRVQERALSQVKDMDGEVGFKGV
jgi:drug/metabolite transporter (DMT)-like permease